MTYRFFTPPPARAATGLTADVYRQLREEFLGPVPTFQALSPVPELLAATWGLLRASLLAGPTSRVERELVAAAVSQANRCRFCVDAHVLLLHALGERDLAETIATGDTPRDPRLADLVTWAYASRTPAASAWSNPYIPELAGTVLTFHFINRVVSALLDPDLLPGGLQRSPLVRSTAGRVFARTARRPVDTHSTIDTAYTALKDVALRGADLLSPESRHTVIGAVGWEDGRHPDRPADWADELVSDLPAGQHTGTRIALLTAFAPHAISASDVAAWRLTHPTDADLVRLVAFGAITATDHVADSLARTLAGASRA